MDPIFKMNDEQRAYVAGMRTAFFVNESQFAGIEADVAAGYKEGQLIRELDYRKPLVGNSAPVLPEAWRRIDERSTVVMRDVLGVFSRLAAANTTPVSMGDIVSYFGQTSDSNSVSVTMDGQHPGNADRAVVKYVGTPTPIITDEARFGWREMEVMRKSGTMLQTDTFTNMDRKIAEKLEDMALNGDAQIDVNGAKVYGLRNHPLRNTTTHGIDLNSAATGANWLTVFSALIAQLLGDNAFGRVTVFLNYSDYVYADLNEFTAGYPKTILQRLREIERIADIVPCSKVPADDVIGVADLASGMWGTILSGMPPTTIPLARRNMTDPYVFQKIASQTPQLRTDFDGRAPFAHLTRA